MINAIRCKNKTAQFARFIDINSTIITNRRQLCQEFNKYFVNVANNLNISKYQDTPPPDHSCYLRNSVKSSIFLASINEEEVNDIILNLDNHKSNDISPKLLKSLSGNFSRILTYFFNLCKSSGVFPDELKVGKIVPLYKSGNKSIMSNYRPISILPTISKIFEKLLRKIKRSYQFFSKK